MSILKTVLNIAAPLPDLTGKERFLFIGPHPDDIEIGAGATAARLAAEGKKVCFLICIDGRYGTDEIENPPEPEELAKIRRREAADSAARLGVEELRFLELCDGGFYRREELMTAMAGQSEISSRMLFSHPTRMSGVNAIRTTGRWVRPPRNLPCSRKIRVLWRGTEPKPPGYRYWHCI